MARASRSSPIGRSNPASRSAALSEPNVCQYSDFDGQRAAAEVEILGGGCPSELLAEAPEHVEQLLARREAARREAGLALRRVPGAEVIDHGLGMHGRGRVQPELAHRGAASQALGARAELGEDLVIVVATAKARPERGEPLWIDACNLRVARVSTVLVLHPLLLPLRSREAPRQRGAPSESSRPPSHS